MLRKQKYTFFNLITTGSVANRSPWSQFSAITIHIGFLSVTVNLVMIFCDWIWLLGKQKHYQQPVEVGYSLVCT